MGLLSERSEDDEERGELVLSGLDGLDAAGSEELVYELEDWSDGDRAVLRERLDVLAVPHRWEAESLVVDAADQAWVERIMDQVDDELSVALDPDAERIAYDLAGWDDHNRALLLDGLDDEAIPHGVEGDELVIHEIDEQRVDEIIESIRHPDAAPPAGDSGSGEVMGALFVAADRLARDPRGGGAGELTAAIQAGTSSPPPYGMDRLWWDGVLAQAGELVALVQGDVPDDDAVAGRARTLREDLRPYV